MYRLLVPPALLALDCEPVERAGLRRPWLPREHARRLARRATPDFRRRSERLPKGSRRDAGVGRGWHRCDPLGSSVRGLIGDRATMVNDVHAVDQAPEARRGVVGPYGAREG